MNCAECNSPLFPAPGILGEISETLVGYFSPPGHDHDDNCRCREFVCEAGHKIKLSKRNFCPTEGCDWKGRSECFCHLGKKLEKWPDEGVSEMTAREAERLQREFWAMENSANTPGGELMGAADVFPEGYVRLMGNFSLNILRRIVVMWESVDRH